MMIDDPHSVVPAQPRTRSRTVLGILAYSALLGLVVRGFLAIRDWGERLYQPSGARTALDSAAAAHAHSAEWLRLWLALITIVLASRLVGAAFRYLRQPAVIGEVLAGILLGPSLLGAVSPTAYALLLPQAVAGHLSMLAQLGVVLYMFLVGLELDTRIIRDKTHATAAISHASIGLPLLLGALAALWLYPTFSSASVPFGVFALFLGVSLSVTAFPVLARILTDRGMSRTPLGVVALSCAAVDDVSAWCLLALLVGISRSSMYGVAVAIAGTAVFVTLLVVAVRPWVHRIVRAQELRGHVPGHAFTLALVAMLASASATEYIGVHGVFGAFMAGAIVPHDSRLAAEVKRKLEDVVVVLLLPAFFALTGMRTQLSLLSGVGVWLACLAIIFIACLGKIGGSVLAARIVGMSWRESASLGVLMNTRGLMELIVLNIGLELGVISPTLFAMLVIMALVTTFATSPLLALLQRPESMSERALAPSA